jgi:hypothetical protein
MAYVEPDVDALRLALEAAFPDYWAVLLTGLDATFGPENEPQESHYAWFTVLVWEVLQPAIERGDAALCNRVLAFALPLHRTSYADAVQHRVLRYSCRPDKRASLLPLLDAPLRADLEALCLATDSGR